MPQYAIYRFDVTTLTQEQRNMLDMMVTVQAEESDQPLDHTEGLDNYSDVTVERLCPWCHAVLDFTEDPHGECGGEGEGACTESAIITSYNPDGGTLDEVEDYVRWACKERGVENKLVPWRNDGLTYFEQLAYLVSEYHGLEQPKKVSRRLP